MFSYYLQLGLRSLRRNPVLTGLMVMAIGFGVAASMTTYSVFRAVSGNPIPDKSSRLFTPQIDNWGPQQSLAGNGPLEALSFVDATALMRMREAKRQTFLYTVFMSVMPDSGRDASNYSNLVMDGIYQAESARQSVEAAKKVAGIDACWLRH